MKTATIVAFLLTLVLTTNTRAHPGPRVWIGNVGGTLATYTSNNDLSPATYTPQRLFVGGIDQDTLTANGEMDEYPVPGTGIFATDFPGYQVRLDHPNDVAGGGIDFGTTFGFKLAGPLLVYDDAHQTYHTAQQMFGSAGAAPQISLSVNSPSPPPPVITGAGRADGFNFYAYNGATDHDHLIAELQPDGQIQATPGDGPHVVFAVPLRLTANGFADSLPFVVLYGRDVTYPDDQEFLDALDTARTSYGFPGDANLDGRVDVADLGTLATNYGQTGFWTDGDFSGDGNVDVADLGALATNYGNTGVGGTSILSKATFEDVTALPETSSMWLLTSFIGALALRRRGARKASATHLRLLRQLARR